MLTYVNTDGNRLVTTRLASWIPDWRPSEAFAEARQYLRNLTASLPSDASRGSLADIEFEPASVSTFNKPRLRVKGCILEEIESSWKMLDFESMNKILYTEF
jgi:hypothetical protein